MSVTELLEVTDSRASTGVFSTSQWIISSAVCGVLQPPYSPFTQWIIKPVNALKDSRDDRNGIIQFDYSNVRASLTYLPTFGWTF